MDRNAWLTRNLPRDRLGLEIGPLDRPIVNARDYQVEYADHLDQTGLREKYASHDHVSKDLIPEIKHVIGQQSLIQSVGKGRLHYVVASHVIEHVPNPISWLGELSEMLADGGTVNLAIPDKRQCFDALRKESVAGEWIEAFLERSQRPSTSRIFDALANEVKFNGAISWHGYAPPEELKLSRDADMALKIAHRVFDSREYFDVHCWTFTPHSFLELMKTVADTGLIRLSLESHTDVLGHEFLVRLKRDDKLSRSEIVSSYGPRDISGFPDAFSPSRYLQFNPDVELAGADPFEHFLKHGKKEGRRFL